MSFKFVPHWSVKSPSQLALLTYWDELAAGRRFPAIAELKPDPGMHDPKQLLLWNVEGSGRLQKYRAVFQGDNVAEAFKQAWAGKTMEQVVPMSLRRVTLDAARECATGGCPVYAIYSTIDANDTRVDCHRLLLPFGNDDTRVEQILASLQLTMVNTRTRVLNHFQIQTDVLVSGRIQSGFSQPKAETAVADKRAARSDKRRASRRAIKRSARISFAKQNLTCTVRNVSATGASIEAANPTAIPDSFRMVMEMETTARRCAVVWRKPTSIGVKFT
ncbi:PilZ domain-containing protein [Bradyrhizobium sp. KBS0727]|uniref:PilZ domain-containing protein n=1 Tax=unclassified Bradyrhizobium TaxID=2631580 RepID=UPI00110D3E0C|nr:MULTISPECIES: PilZ domain-containing protein [unclassified Bradyrhizobium]QDW39299.1 PilZ domain-containing protein [Bradyrhizobium sp. KBS0725]QDW45902.1 PilZ domain-containing protein [Bradyrhizobium sp. KBS0727]